MLELVTLRLLCAVAQPHIYSETVAIAVCAGGEFTAKGKTVKHPGWKALEDAYRAKMKDAETKKEGAEKALPELTKTMIRRSRMYYTHTSHEIGRAHV